MRKDYRQNYKAGTNPFARKSNLQKIAETFGPKKKVKKDEVKIDNFGLREEKTKGGRAGLKRGGGKFPDYSGDGKITMKDILMGRGVIKKKKKKKMMAKKFKSPMEKSIKGTKA